MAHVVIHVDGYVSEHGFGGWAFIARGEGVDATASGALRDPPSHLAEWVAASEALAWAEAHVAPGSTLELRTDSALVAKGLASRRPAMAGAAGELRARCRQALARLAEGGVKARVVRVDRRENADADAAARSASGAG